MISKTLKEFKTSTSSKIKKLKLLYKLIQQTPAIKADELAEKAHLSPATCARLLDELSKKQLILTDELGESTGGRKPILYRINPSQGYLVGIEITNIYSTIVLLDFGLDIKANIKIKTPNIQSTYQTIDFFIAQVEMLLKQHSINIQDVLGIGVVLDELSTRINLYNEQTTTLIEKIKDYIYQQLPTYVTLGSGVNFAALAEYRLYYATEYQRFLFTSCDEEIRCCILNNETDIFQQSTVTNAFGHSIVDLNGSRCSCGSFGCLQTFSALPAIKNRILQQLKRGKASKLTSMIENIEDIDYYMIFEAIQAGDELCHNELENAAYHYGIALANIILVFQPDIVVCSGTLVPKGAFFQIVKKTIEDKITLYPQLKTVIYPAKDSYDIVARGAGQAILEHFWV